MSSHRHSNNSVQLPPLHESDDEDLEDADDEEPQEDRTRVNFTGISIPRPLHARDRRAISDPTSDAHGRRRGSGFLRNTMSHYLPSFRATASFQGGSGGDAAAQHERRGRNLLRRHHLHGGPSKKSRQNDNNLRAAQGATYVRYRVGDNVLVSNHQSKWANLVNRYGFPPGDGVTPEEQSGPYLFVLATVTKVHFEENSEYYTVTRADSGAEQRANAEWMEPLRTPQGEAAAMRAATERSAVDQSSEEFAETPTPGAADTIDGQCWLIFQSVSAVICLPLVSLYHLLYAFVWRPISWLGTACMKATRLQAKKFLNGAPPYALYFRITMVNMLVLCSIWYMFIDQARIAFFAPSVDYGFAVVSFIVWLVLVFELIFELFIRPDGYADLIQSDKAYSPSTARFINSFHLFVEALSLGVFVPEFICVLSSPYQCGERPSFSYFNAAMMAVLGPNRTQVFYGRAYMALVRLRVFGLVRHWKNMWINNTFVTMKWKSNPSTAKDLLTRHIALSRQDSVKYVAEDQQEKDWSLVHASNIGTALMVTNSHRALLIMWVIMGIFPLLYCVLENGRANRVAPEMVDQLQALNLLLNDSSDADECVFLIESLATWLVGVTTGNKAGYGDVYALYLELEPVRCGLTGVVTRDLCFSLNRDNLGEQELELVDPLCAVWSQTYLSIPDEDLADIAGIRTGSIYNIGTDRVPGNLTLEDGTQVLTEFAVVAKFNQSLAVEPASVLSFLLQLSLLICVLGGLSVLRRDAAVLVLGPLRRMLKIVARYAKNPLAHTTVSQHNDMDSDDDSASSRGSPTSQLGSFETEQLITAIAKIADLLRKCWGVAGADIISTNLATQEGTLTEVFNPTVPGKSVYALFGFVAIQGFDHILRNLGDDVSILINDVAAVLHGEVYRWGFGDSGQCNKNLGSAFLMVYRIGLVKEVIQKLEQATDVVFNNPAKRSGVRHRRNRSDQSTSTATTTSNKSKLQSSAHADTKASRLLLARTAAAERRMKRTPRQDSHNAMSLSLQSLPGISAFTDRAVIGMLKTFAGIYRDKKLQIWKRDFRLGAGVGAFSINLIFGMDAGWAQEGAVGSSFKIDATYLSPHVNMASRMMSACKQYGVSILLSQAVQELMSDTARSKLRHLDTITVKGSTLKQKIYTYDARHKGVDFFLYARSEEQADLDSERYAPSIWNADQDLKAMREHVSDDFLHEFNKGRDAYLAGDWTTATKHLEAADNIMVENVREMGYLEADLDDDDGGVHDGNTAASEVERSEMEDGPTRCLLNFIQREGGQAPDNWKGYRPLLTK